MKNSNIKHIMQLSKLIKNYLYKNNYVCNKRVRKTNIIDGIIFKFLYGRKDTSQEKVTAIINNFMNRKTITSKVSRQSYSEREKQVTLSIYEGLYNIIDKFANKYIYDSTIKQVYSVDGTHTNLSKTLTTDGFKTTKNGDIVNGLIIGVYNVTYNFPVSLELSKTKDERRSYLDFIRNNHKYKDCIFLFDRGFVDHKLFTELDKLKINYLCHLRDNSLVIPKDSVDKVVHDKHKNKMRVITYTINEHKYYLATNLFDSKEYSITKLKDLYHQRWKIEEYFKYIKKTMTFDNMTEKHLESLKKTIYAQLITSRIVDILAYIKGPSKSKSNLIINKSVLTDGIYNDFLLRIISNKKISMRTIRAFLTINTVYVQTQAGKHNPRRSIKPYTKWYIKRYYKKYMCENKEKVKQQIKDRINKKKKLNHIKK